MTTASIAMCTYNGERFLHQQLDSILNQSRAPDELIICDDSSTDKSLEIIKEFANAAPFKVKVYRNKINLGYVKNFDLAISFCSKDIIFLCDQDDIWAPSKLLEMIATFDTEPDVGMVLHNYNWIDEYSCLHYPKLPDTYGYLKLSASNLPEEIRSNSVQIFMTPYPRAWCGCMMAFRSHFKNIILPIFPGKGHDDWVLKLLGPITHVRFITSELVSYRVHATNTNRRDLDKRTIGELLIGRYIKKLKLIFNGHTKYGFYREILRRLTKSGHTVIYRELLISYKRWCSRL
jgi:glycosyltransferase involved in cell wall biosynthesis